VDSSKSQPRYFAHITQRGPVKYDQLPCSIGVLEALDNPMPIGAAHFFTWDENGPAVWSLRIGTRKLSGRWVIVDREFLAVMA
jgi:hypothetical protein